MELVKRFEMICKLSKLGHSSVHRYLMIPEYVADIALGAPEMTLTQENPALTQYKIHV